MCSIFKRSGFQLCCCMFSIQFGNTENCESHFPCFKDGKNKVYQIVLDNKYLLSWARQLITYSIELIFIYLNDTLLIRIRFGHVNLLGESTIASKIFYIEE